MNDLNNDIEYIQRCCTMIEKKLNWRPADEWRNYEFTELSEKILDATDVNLSSTTLKRIFGRLKYNNLPSSTTLNALAVYVGFSSWMEFKSQNSANKKIVTVAVKKRKVVNLKTWVAGITAISICAILALIFLSGKSSPAIKNADSIVFTSRPVTDGLPNSVVFNVDLKGNTPDNIVIQQYWDSTKTVRLQHGQTEATAIYYFPGYFRAKLILDGKIIKEHDLFIKSDTWMATIDHDPVPTYLKEDELIFDHGMKVSESFLSSIAKINEPVYLTYHLVRPFDGLQSDNFILEASIRNIYAEGPAVCKTARIFVLCTKGAFIVPFTIPGCTSDINLKASDLYLGGKANDLSSFGADLADWSPVKVEVKDRHLKIFLNNKLIREEVYKEDAGEVVGLRFSFLGAGAVNNVKLSDGRGEVAYKNEFERR